MKIGKYSVVTIKYTLCNKDGDVLDQSDDQDLLTYMQGTDYLVPGLEKGIEGHEVGDKFKVEVKAEDGYGPYHDTLVQEIPVSMFGGAEIHVNDSFLAETAEGQRPVTVRAINDDKVVVDGNHPLAGVDLYFSIEVVDVREPTAEEKDHGHVHHNGHCEDEHDEGCCCHGHHHHDDDDDEHEHHCCHGHHHHHDDDDDENEHHCCHGHHHHDDDDEHEHHCCGKHHHE